jgi:hypothetical protein
MHHPPAVRGLQRLGDLRAIADDRGQRQRPATEQVTEGLTLDELHDQKVGTLMVSDVEERADVGMVELRDGLGLTLEARLQAGVLRELGRQDLDGHAAVEAGVVGAPDLPHPPRPKKRGHLVRTEAASGSDLHGRWSVALTPFLH